MQNTTTRQENRTVCNFWDRLKAQTGGFPHHFFGTNRKCKNLLFRLDKQTSKARISCMKQVQTRSPGEKQGAKFLRLTVFIRVHGCQKHGHVSPEVAKTLIISHLFHHESTQNEFKLQTIPHLLKKRTCQLQTKFGNTCNLLWLQLPSKATFQHIHPVTLDTYPPHLELVVTLDEWEKTTTPPLPPSHRAGGDRWRKSGWWENCVKRMTVYDIEILCTYYWTYISYINISYIYTYYILDLYRWRCNFRTESVKFSGITPHTMSHQHVRMH